MAEFKNEIHGRSYHAGFQEGEAARVFFVILRLASDWEECAEALRLGESYSAKRLAAKFTKDGALEFHSPRNASGRGDYYRISKNCAESLSKHIFEVIHEL